MLIRICQNKSEKVAFVWADKRHVVYLNRSLTPSRLADLLENGFDDYAASDLNSKELYNLCEEYCIEGNELFEISCDAIGQWQFFCDGKKAVGGILEIISRFLLEC